MLKIENLYHRTITEVIILHQKTIKEKYPTGEQNPADIMSGYI